MLDTVPFNTYPGMIRNDGGCRRCGQGPVTTSDGFSMCENCGNWQCAKSLGIDLNSVKEAVINTFKKIKAMNQRSRLKSNGGKVLKKNPAT